MVVISETSDDGSNGGDLTKIPQELHKKEEEEEEENQNENPEEEEDQEEEVENLPQIPQELPEELIEMILLLVRRCHYPKLSLISRAFRHVISSQELYERRLHLGLTKPVLYALIEFPLVSFPSWYILNRNIPRNISLRLTRISSLPLMLLGSAVVTIGYDIYVIGGFNSRYLPTSNVFLIDCRFHKCRPLPRMQRARGYAAAGLIDGRIYVVGGCEQRDDNWIEVFDVDNRIWSTVPGPYDYNSSMIGGGFLTYVVMQDMIYIMDPQYCLVYEPRQGTLQSWGVESPLKRFWHRLACVIEDLLYSIDPWCVSGHPIVVYDPTELFWRVVNGVYGLPKLNYFECTMANFGGKLVILGSTYSLYGFKDIWCVEIGLEKCEGGENWGKVESISLVLRSVNSPFIDLCRSVTF